MSEKLLSIEDVAEMIPTATQATLRYWRRTGYGPQSAKIGRRVVYRQSDVQAWIDEQFQSPVTADTQQSVKS